MELDPWAGFGDGKLVAYEGEGPWTGGHAKVEKEVVEEDCKGNEESEGGETPPGGEDVGKRGLDCYGWYGQLR